MKPGLLLKLELDKHGGHFKFVNILKKFHKDMRAPPNIDEESGKKLFEQQLL